MYKMEKTFREQPLLSVLLVSALSIGAMRLSRYLLELAAIDPEISTMVIRYSISALLILLMVKLNWAKQAGIIVPYSKWHKRWWLATLPMLLIGIINLFGNNWSAAEFTFTATIFWISDNFAVGLFEETLLRGVCFYILHQAWQHQRGGLLKAAIMQGAVFGLLHLLNLGSNPVIDTVAQVIYATLLGVGFAGLVAFTRSIWPAVLVHFFINLMGSPELLMPEAPSSTESGVAGYAVAIVLISLLSTAPGIWLLKKANRMHAQAAS